MIRPPAISADAWNELYPVGTPVRYWNIAGDPAFVDSRTRSAAWDSGGDPIVMIDGRAGGVCLSHLLPISYPNQELYEALADLYDKCGPLVEGLSDDASPMNYVSVLIDNLLCIKQSMSDAEIAMRKAE